MQTPRSPDINSLEAAQIGLRTIIEGSYSGVPDAAHEVAASAQLMTAYATVSIAESLVDIAKTLRVIASQQ